MKSKRKLTRWKVGEVFEVPLGDGRVGFGIVLEEPLMAFFDRQRSEGEATPPVEDIVRAPVAFRILVMRHAIADGSWPVIGRVSVPKELQEAPWFFKQDALSGEVTITRTGAEEVRPAPGQAERLECAAVWEPEHVTDRLRDHFDGRPNVWVESMKIKR